MKKFIVLGMLCLIGMTSFAQKINFDFNKNEGESDLISPVVKEKIEEYALEVRKIVVEEKILINAEISKVDSALITKTINSSEADRQKEEISQRYSDKIDERIHGLNFDLDEITKKQVQYTILSTDVEKLSKENELNTLHDKYKAKNEVTGYLSYGMMYFPDDDNELLNKHLGYSSGIDAGFAYHKQFNRTSPWEFISGFYFSWRTMRFDDDYMINRTEEGDVNLIQHGKNLEKSKLRSTYIVVPVGLKFNISPLKKVTDEFSYRNIDRGIGIGANLYGGFRISKNNIVKGEDISFREKDTNYNLSPFIYGAQVTLSFNDLNFFVRQELSSYFEDNTFDDRKMLQFGINLGF